MKKILAAFLACVTILSVSGCGKQELSPSEIKPIGGIVRLEEVELPETEEENPPADEELQEDTKEADTQSEKKETAETQEKAEEQKPAEEEKTEAKEQADNQPEKQQEQQSTQEEPEADDTPQEEPQQLEVVEVPNTKPTDLTSGQAVQQQTVKEEKNEKTDKADEDEEDEEEQAVHTSTVKRTGEIKAIWISYLDFLTLMQGKSQSQFTSSIGNAFDKIKSTGLNTVIVQVRPFGDALYDSKYFPWSYIASGTEGVSPGYDPLKIMIREAHNRGLQIEAWVNPYRIRIGGYTKAICDDNIAMEWYRSGTGDVVKYNGGFYYNPGSEKAQNLIVKGVVEIVENYDVDGIHFDDYFYPTTDTAFDKTTYKNSGTSLSLADWRRENVNKLVKATYSAIKKVDSSVRFGISPQGNFSNNYNQQYSDVELWMRKSGYVDYICPQLYWAFKHKTAPYKSMVAEWDSKVRSSDVELYIGLAAYKIGTAEASYAGEGVNEWKTNSNILARMVETARTADNYGGFMLFRYDSLYNPSSGVSAQVKKELSNLKEVL
ncbi:MAG: family 10 glycosylhydrolase [Oscillospiraceae bacterium]|nr:family 10 glycosylhydrolase [Oscillospiraceae bacterium]